MNKIETNNRNEMMKNGLKLMSRPHESANLREKYFFGDKLKTLKMIEYGIDMYGMGMLNEIVD
jgi:hypothetical protein